MKFLVIVKDKGIAPLEAGLKLVEPQMEWLEKGLSSGLLDCCYAIPGLPGGMVIGNCDSLEDLQDLLEDYPYSAFVDYTIYPLSDYERAIRKAVEQERKLAQMMQG